MKVNFEVSAKAARLIGRENIADVETEIYYNNIYVDFLMERYEELKEVKWHIPDEIKKYKVLKL